MGRKFGFSFSYKRALGISGAKSRISRKIGVPLTRSGRQRKIGRATGCFIATAAYGDYNCNAVLFFRSFRDNICKQNRIGRLFISFYYLISPPIAFIIQRSKFLQFVTRQILSILIKMIKLSTKQKKQCEYE